MSTEIRWQQRFANFEKAYKQLVEITEKKDLNKFEQAGLIKTFEFTFELAWKTMKDKLNYEGFDVSAPRQVIKQAFQEGYIQEAKIWLDALDKRNLMIHTYDETRVNEAVVLIKDKYFHVIRDLYFNLKKTSEQ